MGMSALQARALTRYATALAPMHFLLLPVWQLDRVNSMGSGAEHLRFQCSHFNQLRSWASGVCKPLVPYHLTGSMILNRANNGTNLSLCVRMLVSHSLLYLAQQQGVQY